MELEKIEKTVLERVKAGKIPCAACFKIAEDFSISRKEMGEILDGMKIKISQCQLGCFE